MILDIEDIINQDEILTKHSSEILFYRLFPKQDIVPKLQLFMEDLINMIIITDFDNCMNILRKKYKLSPKKSQLLYLYRKMCNEKKIRTNDTIEYKLIKRAVRSMSGILSITIMTSPGKTSMDKAVNETIKDDTYIFNRFSCPHNCHYCPDEPGMPRSYLSQEPSVLRGHRNEWNPVKQFRDRAITQELNGHVIDKIEILVLGGTWSSYPREYQSEFIRDIYYSANTYYDKPICNKLREKYTLEEEMLINETTYCHIIGLTLETRPDKINKYELCRFRMYGVTRVQLGIQHTENYILKQINRECTTEDAITAIHMLKDHGFKIDIHIMPNLPFTTTKLDYKMFNYILDSSDLQADQWKIYPCEVVPFTQIAKWYTDGTYKPYNSTELFDILIWVKTKMVPWIRINRLIRDIPNQYDLVGDVVTNLRQHLQDKMYKDGLYCKCIRCREIQTQGFDIYNIKLVKRIYNASKGTEIFISYETIDEKYIYGFLRLRIPSNKIPIIFEELHNAALVRELHVYGRMLSVSDKHIDKSQHKGLGHKLLYQAELEAFKYGYNKLAVISGNGVRNYYRKFGYNIEGTYMIKYIISSEQILVLYLPIIAYIIFLSTCYIYLYNITFSNTIDIFDKFII
jgi:ELP3 family radical SAM enzyme/protein acetyltransferase